MMNFKKEFHPSVLFPSLTVGLANAVLMISMRISYAALIFSGALQPFLPRGIGLMLLGTMIVSIVIALTSSLEGVIGVPQDIPTAMMALVAGGIAAALGANQLEAAYATTIAAIAFSTMLTALIFLALGWFKASAFARYVPYPVVGGFLAGTGFLLAKGSLSVMVDIPPTLGNLPKFFAPDVLPHWLFGVVFGLSLYFFVRRFNHFLATPAAMFAAIGIFYVILFASGYSIQDAVKNGWLLGAFPEGGLLNIFSAADWSQIHWGLALDHFGTYLTLVLLSVISMLLNASGLEVIYKKNIDLDRELMAAGGANLLGSFFGSVAGYQALGLSAMAGRFGARTRLTGIFAGLLCGAALFFGGSLIVYFPKPILGGMLFMLGASFLWEWLVDSYNQLPITDYALVWVMLVIIQLIGFLQAVGAGVVIAALLFVFSYGSISVIKNIFSGDSFHSQAGRSTPQVELLAEKGAQIYILRLQGYIFFGSVQRVTQKIHARMLEKDSQPLKYLVLDFKRVTRLDSSAVFGIVRLKQLTDANGISMTWTNLAPDVMKQMKYGGADIQQGENFSIQPTLDYGVEWCENQLLAKESPPADETLISRINRAFPGFERVKKYLQEEFIEAGEYLIRQGESSNDMFFIESGMVTVEFESSSGEIARLRSVRGGATVGEISLYLGGTRSASVKAEQASRVYRLTKNTLQQIHKEDADLAALLHEWLGHLLAERLADNNRMIESLLD